MKRQRESDDESNKNDLKKHKEDENGLFVRVCGVGEVDVVRDMLEFIDASAKIEGMLEAAHYGHLDIVKVLLQNGVNVNAADIYKKTALHKASSNGHADVVKVLIQNGADVNAVDDLMKRTALHCAAADTYVDVVKVLIENGADVNAVTNYDQTALHFSVVKGHADLAKLLLQNGADVKNAAEALFTAAIRGNLRCVFNLLCFGAEISDMAIDFDKTKLLRPVEERLRLLRNGNRIGTSLMQNEGRKFMWNLAFFFTIKHRAAAFKAYYAIRSFITFHGIFVVPGYALGEDKFWKRTEEQNKIVIRNETTSRLSDSDSSDDEVF